MAEAFLPFSEIPDTGHERGIETLDQIHLKLSKPTDRSKIPISLKLWHNVQYVS